jgi:ubiquinone/menaquinone biosynthesis C-methylase UbiE
MINDITKNEWDYSEQAKYYYLRPNYSPEAIDELVESISKNRNKEELLIADIGAGTGNLSIILEEKGFKIIAIEPNENMRNIGIERSKNKNIEWRKGTGENNTLLDKSVDIITFGSSFNTTNRDEALKESYRVLKDDGFFVCMWNNRDLEFDPIQKRVENIIKKHVPDYSHGTRREPQDEIIIKSNLFKDLYYINKPQKVTMTLDSYIDAWKSVKNKYWDLSTKEGLETFDKIISDIRIELSNNNIIEMVYITKIWFANKKS